VGQQRSGPRADGLGLRGPFPHATAILVLMEAGSPVSSTCFSCARESDLDLRVWGFRVGVRVGVAPWRVLRRRWRRAVGGTTRQQGDAGRGLQGTSGWPG
jgi:hypothetical protein